MTDNKNDQDLVTDEEEKVIPMNILFAAAKDDFMEAILNVEKKYNIPSYMTESFVTACLADIRDVVLKELLHTMNPNI